MAKAKAKKRFVLGEGYPWKHIDGYGEYVYLSKKRQYPNPKVLLFWPDFENDKHEYRLVLEEI